MKLVFCIINAQIDQTKRKIEICSVSHNRNAKWEMRNPKPKPESSKPENQNSSKPETNPSTKSKSKSKTKTMREANENANQNSKRNHIMTIAKRSDNAKCEIKFACAPVPLAPCCLCWLHSILVQTMIALGRHRCVAAATKYCTLAMAICHSLVCARILWHRGGHIEPLPALRGVYVLRSQAVLSWTGHGRTECSASF